MAQRLKRWESPRNEGRNDKGRGGSARQRQLKKQRQALRRRLKDQADGHNDISKLNKKGGNGDSLPFYLFDCAILRLTVLSTSRHPIAKHRVANPTL